MLPLVGKIEQIIQNPIRLTIAAFALFKSRTLQTITRSAAISSLALAFFMQFIIRMKTYSK